MPTPSPHRPAGRLRRLTGASMRVPRRRLLAGLLGSLAGLAVACAVLLPFRDDLSPGTIALLLLVPTLMATLAGPAAALGIALFSGLLFNLLFTEPYYSPLIEAPESVAALLVYLVVAGTLAIVLSRVRAARALADERARELDLLRSVAAELLRRPEAAAAMRDALGRLRTALGMAGVAVRLASPPPGLTVSDGRADRALRAVAVGDGEQPVGAAGVLVAPVVAAGGVHGVLAADAGDRAIGPEDARVVANVADLLGLAATRLGLEQERVARQTLEETERLRTALVRAVSHDLRTPLAGIQAAAGALRGGAPPEERDALAADIEGQAGRLGRLVSDMLDMSRIQAGVLEPRREVVPVGELAGDALDAAAAGLAGREVRVDAPPDLAVACDEAMMRQVLVNLLDNAARHAPDGGPVEVRAWREGDRVLVGVADHGPGIAPADRERVTEPFVRLAGPSPGRGAGLGLAIGRGLVEAQGGRLRVEETPGGGTTVVVELPAGEGPA